MANDGNKGKSGHRSSDLRNYPRRLITDRRKDIRWEPKTTNRRENSGRRTADALGRFGNKR
jgi:hypothetical protein